MKYVNIKNRYFLSPIIIVLIILSGSACVKRSGGTKYCAIVDSTTIESNSAITSNDLPLQKKDSIYIDLIVKTGSDSVYSSVIKYLVDTLFSTYLESYHENEPFFNNPLNFLTKTTINDKTFVTAELRERSSLFYFLLDKEYNVIDHIEFSTWRKTINSRQIYDWNRDGVPDIIETRQHHGQMWSAITNVVYSIADNAFKRVFSLETHELNCIGSFGYNDAGIVTHRDYRQTKFDVFEISEVVGYVKCENDTVIPNNATPFKIRSRNRYEMTTQELLKKYGQQFEKDR